MKDSDKDRDQTKACFYPECTNSRRTRGLCHQHYQTMRGYVRAGKVAEEDLEARGFLAPKGEGSGWVCGHDAFLDPNAYGDGVTS
jgi:hypothetical protein